MSNTSIDDQEMPLVAHLTELRKRLLRCVVAILLLFGALFYFSQQIYALVAAPLRAYLPEGATMIATGVASPFLTPFKLTMMVALFLSMPVILHQIWSFIAPGLYKHEKRVAVPLLISSIVLFYGGEEQIAEATTPLPLIALIGGRMVLPWVVRLACPSRSALVSVRTRRWPPLSCMCSSSSLVPPFVQLV